MGFGECKALPAKSKKRHCTSFYWDLSSIIAKSVCLTAFLVVEGPRRVVCYATRKPEPKPFFTCARWGYRMCACGHHFYDHDHVRPIKLLTSEDFTSPQPGSLTTPIDTRKNVSEEAPLVAPANTLPNDTKSKRKRKRRWYWPF